jgi:oligopeptide transport system substrate-binding protein
MWKRELGIRWICEPGMGLVSASHHFVAVRRGAGSWIGDYLDPTTFLSIMMTGDGNNRTGWSDAALRPAAA